MSRLATIGDGTNIHASYKYLGAGKIVVEDYEDIDVKLTYLDSSGNVTGLDRFGRVVDQVWYDYGASQTLDEYTYTYDRAGNRTSKDNELHSAFDEDYTYDDLDRLETMDRADGFDQDWTLDGEGNFSTFNDDGTSQNRTVNAANEIAGLTGSWKDPTYDAAGNMKFGPKPGSETTGDHYVYDAWNRLAKVYQDDGDGVYEPGTGDTLVAQYKYDGSNRRIEKIVTAGADVHYYYNSDWQLVEERESPISNPQSLTSYVWSPTYVDAPIVRLHDGNGDGDLLDAGDNVRYYTSDANHNVTATIDATSGDVVERYVYNAYGKATVYSPTWTSPAAPTTDGPLYCGYFFDAESNLYQVRNRYYNSSLSTFIGRDPIGYKAGDFNLYRYVHNRPTISTDPSGTTDYCGMVDADCTKHGLGQGTIGIHVYGNSPIAEMILALDGITSGCVTLPGGVYCTGSCQEIKEWQKEGTAKVPGILDHEACHYCILKYKGLCAYLKSAGGAPDGCVGHEVPTGPNW